MNGNGQERGPVLSEERDDLTQRSAPPNNLEQPEQLGRYLGLLLVIFAIWRSINLQRESTVETEPLPLRPPFNAEYLLYLVLRREEREVVIGDLIEEYGQVRERFNKRRADIWFYKQVIWSVWPFFRRAIYKLFTLAWLGRILRRLIS